jgi:hypothetical protein
LKEKNMRKNLTVLVLLVAGSFLFAASLPSASLADGIPVFQDPPTVPDDGDDVIGGDGANDDGGDGDPGDAGDGYGASGQPIIVGGGDHGGLDRAEDVILGELWLILISLTQLAP